MTLIVDTSGLVAALVSHQRLHAAALEALEAEEGRLVLSPFVLAVHLVLSSRGGAEVELGWFLEDVSAARYELPGFSSTDVGAAGEVIARYRDLGIGLADASLVVLAERYGTRRILTLDERHFRTLRASDGSTFRPTCDQREEPQAGCRHGR